MEKKLEQTLSQLKSIEKRALDLNRQINEDGRAFEAEQRDATRLGLTTGEARHRHYNEWMAAHHMEHLMLK